MSASFGFSGDAMAATVVARGVDLADLSLEELGNVVVTSVSRRQERLADAPASVFVITREDIRRSGATSLPEALRLAPNLQVARVDANQYAISARGFNARLANKLLVLIDGRAVYTPLFSGVFWDVQDMLLEDVERIEVISGPGATLWGANAVNGVINVITRHGASDARHGRRRWWRQRGAGCLRALRRAARQTKRRFGAYAKVSDRENSELADRRPVRDECDLAQIGFRAGLGQRQLAASRCKASLRGTSTRHLRSATSVAPNCSGAGRRRSRTIRGSSCRRTTTTRSATIR